MDELTIRLPPKCLSEYVRDKRASMLVAALQASFPSPIGAKLLMGRAGMMEVKDPVSSFVRLCIAFHAANASLWRRGWMIERTGGKVSDTYVLVKLPKSPKA